MKARKMFLKMGFECEETKERIDYWIEGVEGISFNKITESIENELNYHNKWRYAAIAQQLKELRWLDE